MKRALQTETEFSSAFSEIEAISLLRRSFQVEIHPEVSHLAKEGEHAPQMDLKITNTSTVYIEVITPETMRELLHSGQAISVKNRVKGMLISEVNKHLKALPVDWEFPFLVMVDRSASEIDELFIEDALLGSQEVVFEVPTGSVEPRAWAVRKNDAITKKTEIALLSGVLLFKTQISLDGVPFYDVQYIPNPTAKYALDAITIDRITQCFPGANLEKTEPQEGNNTEN